MPARVRSRGGTIGPTMPILVLAIIFGLSMDYEGRFLPGPKSRVSTPQC